MFQVDCQWSDWKKTGTCTKSCGGGVQYFERTMLLKSHNQSCIGGPIKRETCNDHDCPGTYDNLLKKLINNSKHFSH